MQVTGTKRICRRRTATTGLLLMLAATAAGADPFGSDGDSASVAASRLPMPAADIASGVGDGEPMSDALLVDAVVVAVDRSTTGQRDGDAPVGQDDEASTFLDQLVTQYFDSYN